MQLSTLVNSGTEFYLINIKILLWLSSLMVVVIGLLLLRYHNLAKRIGQSTQNISMADMYNYYQHQ
jgi:hypothetical protein